MTLFLFIMALFCTSMHCVAQDAWTLTASHPTATPYFGETVANGQLGLVSSAQPLKNADVVLAGAYDKFGRGNVSNFFSSVKMMDMEIDVDGIPATASNIEHYEQQLDMRQAFMSQHFDVPGKAHIGYRQCALRQLPFNALNIVEIEAMNDITITVRSIHQVPTALRSVHFRYNKMTKRTGNIYLLSTDAKSPTGRLDVTSSSSLIFPGVHDPEVIHTSHDSTQNVAQFNIKLDKGQKFSFAITGSLMTSASHPDVQNEADRLVIFAVKQGIEQLESMHVKLWRDLWKSDITISGDNQAQQDVHSMLYHLYSFVRERSRLSVSPMGLSGLGYNGHVFWDADVWIFPALVLLHPDMARSMIDYRIDRLQAAMTNAWEHGYDGAMFPWESSDTGMEETPTWALTGTFEHHITGCVAHAAWQYYCVTRDTAWLTTQAWPLIKATANFWVSRAQTDASGHGYHINNVVCADEYAANVDDNAFTNAIAITNLNIACMAAHIAGKQPNPLWSEVASGLPILKNAQGVTLEHASYAGQSIKQADVNLLAYPLDIIASQEQILKDLNYYAPRIKNGPAMTEAIFALLYARMGNAQLARRYFDQAYKANQCPPFGVIAECKGGTNPYFLTGAGGVLQAVIMGFSGYNITSEGVTKASVSTRPEGWTGLQVTLDPSIRVVSR